MQIINIEKKEQLNNFVSSQRHSQFLQSWQWGEFDKIVSGNVVRLGVKDGDNIVAVATMAHKILPMGKSYFYCPRGPIISCKTAEEKCKIAVDLLFNEIEELAKKKGAMFLRFDPVFEIINSNFPIKKTISVQPEKTSILNLAKSEKEILAKMHQKTRYNIKLSEKKGVEVVEAGMNRFDEFWQLMCETSDRDKFRTHGINYYKEMLKVDPDFIKIFFAEHKRKPISANIVAFFGDTVTYLHGASSTENRDVMAPYAMQWHCINLAKKMGYRYYDFYGINEKRWPGVTRFKKGFSGKTVNYPGTFDLLFDPGWYKIYKMIRKVRRTF
ncbi:MAG: peptidoglycan bridge formation glycyltransferase FemA/FemB family protein [Candidatus Falkowbacteria bacterium]